MTVITRNYDRQSAVNYARKYALTPNPAYKYFSLKNTGGDCTNFTSQCLFAGGIPMTKSWWYGKRGSNIPKWTFSWTIAGSLFWYLRSNASKNNNLVKGYELQSPYELEPGDLIFYEGCDKKIFHSAMVTNFDGSKPLISQHSFDALDINYEKPWSSCRNHYIKIAY